MRVIHECIPYKYDKVKINIKNFNRIISFVTTARMCKLMMRSLETLTGFGDNELRHEAAIYLPSLKDTN